MTPLSGVHSREIPACVQDKIKTWKLTGTAFVLGKPGNNQNGHWKEDRNDT